jgi:hypothetical protein
MEKAGLIKMNNGDDRRKKRYSRIERISLGVGPIIWIEKLREKAS